MQTPIFKETLRRANQYYQNPTEGKRTNLILAYDGLTEEEQKLADVEIQKLLPSWGSY